jgi:hypothetical protein
MTAPVVEHFPGKIERSHLMSTERRGFIRGQRYQQVFLHAVGRRSIPSRSVRVLTDVTGLNGVVPVHHEVLRTIPEVFTDCQQRLVPRAGRRRVRAFRPFQPLRDSRQLG